MPKDRIEFDVSVSLQDAADAVREAGNRLGWKVKGDGPTRLRVKQAAGMTSPAKLDVILTPATDTETSIRLDGSIAGLLMGSKLNDALNSLQVEILRLAPSARKRQSIGESAATQVEALKGLAELREKGVLSPEEFEIQKARLLNEQ